MLFAKKILPCVAIGLFTTTAMAQERQFASVIMGQTSANYSESTRAKTQMPGVNFDRIIDDSGAWGLRVGNDQTNARYYATYDYVSDSYRGDASLRQQSLSVSYDLMLPVADTTRLFAGATTGLTHIKQNTSGYRNDSDWGVHAGIQAGVLQMLPNNLELEAGYRYAKHEKGDVDFRRKGTGGKSGSARLESTEQLYVGLNWRF